MTLANLALRNLPNSHPDYMPERKETKQEPVIQYQDHSDEAVAGYFCEGFPDHVEVMDWYYDPKKGRFIFRLFVDPDKKEEDV